MIRAEKRKGRGGNTMLTKAIADEIVERIRLGTHYDLAVKGLCHYSTFRRWLIKGQDTGEEPYASFAQRCQEAEGENIKRMLAVVNRSAIQDRDWKAAMTLLERRYRNHFNPRIEIGGQVDFNVEVVEGARERLRDRINHLAERAETKELPERTH